MLDHLHLTRLLRRAYRVADASPDPSSQVGAVVSSLDGFILGEACNDFTKGIAATSETLHRSLKYQMIEHAERAAIFAAFGSLRGNTRDLIMVAPWAACADCARAIVLSGIRILVRHADAMERTPERWHESREVGDRIMRAADVEILEIAGHLDATPVLMNGERWTP